MIDISNLPVSLIQKRLISSSASARGLGRSNLGALQNKYLQNLGTENNLTNRIASLRMPGIHETAPDYLDTLQARANEGYLNALQGFSGRLANLPADKPISQENKPISNIPELTKEINLPVERFPVKQLPEQPSYNAFEQAIIDEVQGRQTRIFTTAPGEGHSSSPILTLTPPGKGIPEPEEGHSYGILPDELNAKKHPEIALIYPDAYKNPGYDLVLVNGKPVYRYLIDRYNRRSQFNLTDEEKLYFDYVWNEYGGKELAKYR